MSGDEIRLLRARVLLPSASAPAVDDGAVAWQGERILAVDEYRALRQAYPQAACLDFPDHVVLPGLINAHDHGRALGTLQMGVADAPLEIWISGLFALRPMDPYLAALYEGLTLLAAGVTTTTHQHNPSRWTDLEHELIETARGYRDAGIRACIGLPLMDRNTLSYVGNDAFLARLAPALADQVRAAGLADPLPPWRDSIAVGQRLRRRWQGDPLHWLCWGPVGPQWCSDDLLAAVRSEARSDPIHIHTVETRAQQTFGRRTYGTTPIDHLAKTGFLGDNVTCAHCVWLTDDDIACLAGHGAKVAHNPSSNLRLKSGVAPVLKLMDAGVTVGLGLDGQTLNDDQDMWLEMRLARGLAVEPGIPGRSLSARAVLAMATEAGARIVGGPGLPRGRLAPNHAADLIAVRMARMRGPYLDARTDLAEAVIGRAKPCDLDTVIVAGEIRIAEGRPASDRRAEVEARLEAVLAAPKSAAQEERERLVAKLAAHLETLYAGW